MSGGNPQIKTNAKALVSIRDYIERNGSVEGKRLLETFGDAPYGWSQDTLRYLIAALLIAGEIKLKVSGREVTVNGQQAIEALKTNTSFKSVGVAVRQGRPSNDVLARAATRLTDLVGDQILPLEDEISKTAIKHFPQFQHRFAPIAEKLSSLGLAGAETIRSFSQEIADCLLSDASDAPQRLGGEESALFNGLKWAIQVDVALKQGLETTIRELQRYRADIEAMPLSGIPGKLRADLADEFSLLAERLDQADFFKHTADLNSTFTDIQAKSRGAAIEMAETQKNTIKEAEQDLQRLPAWTELTQEEQSETLGELDELRLETSDDLAGLKKLLSQEFVIATAVSALKKRIEELAHRRLLQRLEEEKAKLKKDGRTKLARSVPIPAAITTGAQIDALIRQLQELKNELALYTDIEITLQIEK